jgi:alpha-L-rhamnosidase
MKTTQLRTELLTEPRGLDVLEPRFSWVVTSDRRGDVQTAYQVVVASRADGPPDLWDSGKVASGETAHIAYAGSPLASDQTCWWRVRVWDGDEVASEWSDAATWTTGLLQVSDWTATWIAAPDAVAGPATAPAGLDFGSVVHRRVPWLRTTFTVDRPVTGARAFATARGVYELHLNGSKVGADVFTPGWTDYRTRIQYQSYDVTAMVRQGDNSIGTLLGDGWYSGRVAWQDHIYGDRPSALVQLHIDHDDGTRTVVTSDGSWTCAPSDLLWSDMLTGEEQDTAARRPWAVATPDADADGWSPVEVVEPPSATLVGQRNEPVRRLLELEPSSITETEPGTFLVDLGQNIVGWLRLTVPGEVDGTVSVRHAEMLAGGGTLYTDNYRAAQCRDLYRLHGEGADPVDLEPHFTWRGFRYAEVTGLPPGQPPTGVRGVVLGSAIPPAGTFQCSSPMVTQLQRNIEWGQRGNFLEVPTDCPQRDERLGWMGDAQVFLPTACWNADVAAFFTKWMDDVLDARAPSGAFADVAPVVRNELFGEAAPAWGDAGVIVPWVLYERYGDRRLLAHCFDAMARWVSYIEEANPDQLWRERRSNDYGDWLSVEEDTPREVLSTAYFARSAHLVGRAARVVGRTADAEHHEALFERIRSAFNEAYVAPSGRIVGHSQTTYVLALAFDLLPEDRRAGAAEALVSLITERRGMGGTFKPGHLATGFLGVGLLLPVLTAAGRPDLAYQLLENESYPSWGYSISQGATTIWERWDGWTDERGFQSPGMNSFNHYSLGSVGHWLFSSVAGIEPIDGAPAFRRFAIHPRPGGTITWATATHDALAGRIESAWERTGDELQLRVVIPANTEAEVWMQGATIDEVQEGGLAVDKADGVTIVGDRNGCAVVRVGGGSYDFAARVRR